MNGVDITDQNTPTSFFRNLIFLNSSDDRHRWSEDL